jgi:hypothetical protein
MAAQRQVLGTAKKPMNTRRTAASNRQQQQDDVFAAPAPAPASRASGSSSSAVARPNGRLAVFVDPEGSAEKEDAGNAWPELEARKVRVKENVRGATKMAGTTLKSKGKKGAGSSKAKAGFVVFKDGEDGEGEEEVKPAPEEAKVAGKGKFAVFCDEEAETEKVAPAKVEKKKFAVFCDEEDDGSKNSKPGKPEKKKFAVFCDEEEETPAAEPAKGGKKFAVFCDEDAEANDNTKTAPATPRFVPFRDEVSRLKVWFMFAPLTFVGG